MIDKVMLCFGIVILELGAAHLAGVVDGWY